MRCGWPLFANNKFSIHIGWTPVTMVFLHCLISHDSEGHKITYNHTYLFLYVLWLTAADCVLPLLRFSCAPSEILCSLTTETFCVAHFVLWLSKTTDVDRCVSNPKPCYLIAVRCCIMWSSSTNCSVLVWPEVQLDFAIHNSGSRVGVIVFVQEIWIRDET